MHLRFTPFLVAIGVLALGGASTARAQDTSAAGRRDTSGYQAYQNQKDTAKAGVISTADTVVCKDGSNAANKTKACGKHGGIDSTATTAALKARGKTTGAPSDTTLKAKPGVQTGPTDTGAAKKADTSMGRPQGP